RLISFVSGWSNSMRDSSAPTPICPDVPNAGIATLRGSCRYDVPRARIPREALRRIIGNIIDRERETNRIRLYRYLNGILNKGSVFGNRPVHGDRSRIVRARVRTIAGAGPLVEPVTHVRIVGWRGADGDTHPGVLPTTSGTHRATGPVGHRQVILRPECRCVDLVSSRRNRVRDRSVVTPPGPQVLDTCAPALR